MVVLDCEDANGTEQHKEPCHSQNKNIDASNCI